MDKKGCEKPIWCFFNELHCQYIVVRRLGLRNSLPNTVYLKTRTVLVFEIFEIIHFLYITGIVSIIRYNYRVALSTLYHVLVSFTSQNSSADT